MELDPTARSRRASLRLRRSEHGALVFFPTPGAPLSGATWPRLEQFLEMEVAMLRALLSLPPIWSPTAQARASREVRLKRHVPWRSWRLDERPNADFWVTKTADFASNQLRAAHFACVFQPFPAHDMPTSLVFVVSSMDRACHGLPLGLRCSAAPLPAHRRPDREPMPLRKQRTP